MEDSIEFKCAFALAQDFVEPLFTAALSRGAPCSVETYRAACVDAGVLAVSLRGSGLDFSDVVSGAIVSCGVIKDAFPQCRFEPPGGCA